MSHTFHDARRGHVARTIIFLSQPRKRTMKKLRQQAKAITRAALKEFEEDQYETHQEYLAEMKDLYGYDFWDDFREQQRIEAKEERDEEEYLNWYDSYYDVSFPDWGRY